MHLHSLFPRFRLSRSQKSLEFLIGAFYYFHPAYITPWHLGSEKKAVQKLIQFYRHFDLVFASSMSLVEKFQEAGLKQIRYLPHGIDIAVFHPDAMDCSMRDHLGLKEDTRLLAYVEYTPGHKNRKVLLEAM